MCFYPPKVHYSEWFSAAKITRRTINDSLVCRWGATCKPIVDYPPRQLQGLPTGLWGFFLVHVFAIEKLNWIIDEFCTSETFNVRCPASNQLIIIRRALYGRLAAGRCITAEYAHAMGCYADVTAHLQDVCAGRGQCSLLVATVDAIAQPCGKDFKSYLDVTHQCVTGRCDASY